MYRKRKDLNLLSLLIVISFLIQGCVPVLVGGGVVAGYTLSNDSAIGNVNVSYRELWDVCKAVLEEEKTVFIKYKESQGYLVGKIGDYKIKIRIETIGENVQKLKVSARKYFLPRPQFAQTIFLKIIKRVE